MNCQQAIPLLDPYADGELEAAAISGLEQHLQSCSACGLAWRNLQNLKKTLSSDTLYFKVSSELHQRIKAELPPPTREVAPRQSWSWNWLTTAVSGAFAICLVLLVMTFQNSSLTGKTVAQEVVSSHIRSLMANHVMDVASTDQHTVKPWFAGKLDFSPPVKDLVAQEFPLVGGRLDYLNGHAVAALVFQRHKHIINLFIWPGKESDSEPRTSVPRQGYNLVYWTRGGMNFWAASDLNEKELAEFAQKFAAE